MNNKQKQLDSYMPLAGIAKSVRMRCPFPDCNHTWQSKHDANGRRSLAQHFRFRCISQMRPGPKESQNPSPSDGNQSVNPNTSSQASSVVHQISDSQSTTYQEIHADDIGLEVLPYTEDPRDSQEISYEANVHMLVAPEHSNLSLKLISDERIFSDETIGKQAEDTFADDSSYNAACDIDKALGYDENLYDSLAVQWTQEIQARVDTAENYCKAFDAYLLTVRKTEYEEDILQQIAFLSIVQRYSLSDQCTEDILAWANKRSSEKPASLPIKMHRSTKCNIVTATKLDPIKVEKRKVMVAKQLLPSVPDGIPITFAFRDPLSVLARMTVEVLHQFGRDTFAIGTNHGSYEHAQDADFLTRTNSILADSCDEDYIVVPFRLHSDGAHMRSNGLHVLTPILVSLVHRCMYDRKCWKEPQIVCTLPSVYQVYQSALVEDPCFPNVMGSSSEISPSIYHGVLHHLFEHIQLIINRNIAFYIWFRGVRIRCFFVLYKMCMDMPMVAQTSFTLTSSPATQDMPCAQCQAKGREEQFYVATGIYRTERDMLRYSFGATQIFDSRRKERNLRRMGFPVFSHMSPFDERGIFQLIAADGLHAFKGLWPRKLVSIALDAMYMNSRTSYDEISIPSSYEVQYERLAEEHPNEDILNPFQALFMGEDADSTDCHEQDEPEALPPSGEASTMGSRGLLGIKTPATRATAILKTARGKRLQAYAYVVTQEASTSMGCLELPMRRISVFDQVSKIQEHKYSMGILVHAVAIVASDTSHMGLGHFRKTWLACATMCIRIYGKLYQKCPDRATIEEAQRLCKQLCASARQLTSTMGFNWNAPKIHMNLHFFDCVLEFGRMRLFDTTEGESALSSVKALYRTICNREIWNFQQPLLEKAEQATILYIFSKWMETGTADTERMMIADAIGITDVDMDTSMDECYTNTTDVKTLVVGKTSKHVFMRYRKRPFHDNAVMHVTKNVSGFPVFEIPFYEKETTFWPSFRYALYSFLTANLNIESDSDWVDVDLHQYNSAVSKYDGSLVCAVNSRYGKSRFDIAAYNNNQMHIQFGRCLAIFHITVRRRDRLLLAEDIAFFNQFSGHSKIEIEKCDGHCGDLDGVLIHASVRRNRQKDKFLECILVSSIQRRATAFRDPHARWKIPDNTHSFSYPAGEWYYILEPSVLQGVEIYN